jgi:Cobalamin biosynthesis protein CobT (nicotinate-mononucleotide:5, 6-dimethylbenzimidazole phosphoribosyltransferase)
MQIPFHLESTQHYDSDGDGYGDNLTGYRGDACPTLAGTSTRANMYDPGSNSYTSISRYGCIDEDGDGYDDNTESAFGDCSMANNRSEWLDEDRDCLGSNADYDDSDPEIKTLEDFCNKYPDDNETCTEAYDPNSGSGNITLLEDEEFDAMGAIKDFAVIAGYIVAAMALVLPVIVITLRTIGKARDKRKPDAQYTHQDATRELDAWESGDDFETRGGIDEQKAWGEELDNDEEPTIEALSTEEISPEEESTESEYVAEQMSIPSQEEVSEETPSEQPDQPPAEAPPLPSGGLPEG